MFTHHKHPTAAPQRVSAELRLLVWLSCGYRGGSWEKRPERDRWCWPGKTRLLEHTTHSSPVFHVSEEIRVSHQVFVHCEIFIKFLSRLLPKDRNGETHNEFLHLITAGKAQP